MDSSIVVPDILKPLISRGAAFGHLGGTSDTRESIGHLKLTYAAKRLFGISRYPTHPERFTVDWYNPGHFNQVSELLETTAEEEWCAICNALNDIHAQTIEQLRKEYPTGRVTLQRRLKLSSKGQQYRSMFSHATDHDDESLYAGRLCISILKARREGMEHIPIDADIITGWCRNDPGAYGEILLRKDFAIEDVLMAAPYMERYGPLEQDEWLVLNRHPAGLIGLSVENVSIPVELESAFLDRSRRLHWDNLAEWRWDESIRRMKPFRLPPGDICRYKSPWFVDWAHRLDVYLARRRKNQ